MITRAPCVGRRRCARTVYTCSCSEWREEQQKQNNIARRRTVVVRDPTNRPRFPGPSSRRFPVFSLLSICCPSSGEYDTSSSAARVGCAAGTPWTTRPDQQPSRVVCPSVCCCSTDRRQRDDTRPWYRPRRDEFARRSPPTVPVTLRRRRRSYTRWPIHSPHTRAQTNAR